jgi:hypothetical protein
MPLKDCCAREAAHTVRRHRDVSTCDGCGRLLIAYADELEAKDVSYDTGRHKGLWIVAKQR